MKTCSKCGDPKDESEFSSDPQKKSGLRPSCKACSKRWRDSKKLHRSAYQKKWYQDHRDQQIAYSGAYWHRRKGDSNFKLAHYLRSRVTKMLRRGQKAGSAVRDLGCSIADFRTYLENGFYVHPITGEVMAWGNYGKWHVDHKRPLDSFDLTDRTQFLQACHYTNLQPLWAEQNLAKGARVDWQREAA